MKTRIKINAIALLIGLILCVCFPYLMFRNSEGRFDDFLEISGLFFILLGFLLRASARGYKAENSASGNSLVTGGPYSLVRNPMYLGIIIAGVGVILVIGRLWALLLFLTGFLLRYLYLFRKEENFLLAAFGEAYSTYMKTVPRIIPNAVSFFRRDVREYLPVKAIWFKSELISIIPVLLAVFGYESWEEFNDAGWLGVAHNTLSFLAIMIAFSMLVLFLNKANEKPLDNRVRNR